MITQLCMTLDGPLPAWAAYPLYAKVLELAPAGFADQTHGGGMTPISQYVHEDRWYISLLGDHCENALGEQLEGLETAYLYKLQKQVQILSRQIERVSDVEELLAQPLPGTVTMALRTPAAFKSSGAYQLLPTQRLLVQSLISKWNGCLGDVCPIEDDGEGMEALAAGLVYRGLQLNSESYPIKQTAIPGTVGCIQMENRLTGFHRQLLDALLRFGTYSGIGIKTTLGMGGMGLEK